MGKNCIKFRKYLRKKPFFIVLCGSYLIILRTDAPPLEPYLGDIPYKPTPGVDLSHIRKIPAGIFRMWDKSTGQKYLLNSKRMKLDVFLKKSLVLRESLYCAGRQMQ